MLGQVKRYGQRCSLARALDVVGERWSLLLVRELSLGPRRYSDLLDGLPGVPTNLLVTRLKDLQAADIITKRTLPPPGVATVYELTDAGRALRPALNELREWGGRYGSAPSETDMARPGWALLSASARPTALPEGRICELRAGTEFFHLSAAESGLSVRGGPAHAADAVITISADTLYHLMAGHTTAAATARQATIDGDPDIAQSTLESLHGALADPQPAADSGGTHP
jgi:DNA-binding HxlR family transcriptional regulator